VRRRKTEINLQKTKRAIGEKLKPLNRSLELEMVKKNINRTDRSKAATPPSLLGIERRIA
jgi:hypothetical protein